MKYFSSQANLEYAARSYFYHGRLGTLRIKPWPKWEVIPSTCVTPWNCCGGASRVARRTAPLTARRVALPRSICTSQGSDANQCLPRSPVYGFSNESHSIFRALREQLAKYATDAKVRSLQSAPRRASRQAMDITSRRALCASESLGGFGSRLPA